MLDTLITSKTRLKLLLKFFLNCNSSSYLRELESEFGVSTNAIRQELNRFENSGFLKSFLKGNKKLYQANTSHPLYKDINRLLMNHVGFDAIIENVIHKLGELKCVYIVGEFARGIDNHIIDLVFVIDRIDKEYMARLVQKAEKLINRKIRYQVYNQEKYEEYECNHGLGEVLLLWKG